MGPRRFLLAPPAWVYSALLLLRHALYDLGLLRSTRPTVPTIAIGNLALGGTGKTPMLELVLRSLADVAPVATLSRGYGRSGTDIHEVAVGDTAERSGDEPLQVKRKFPDVRVFVGADRVAAIARIEQALPAVKAVLLDDALQHRPLDAGLNILLTTAHRPYCDDALVPAGSLRDLRSRARAARIVVVTKCTAAPSAEEQARWRERLRLRSDQELFFAGIAYEPPTPRAAAAEQILPGPGTATLAITGIAVPAPFLEHLRTFGGTVEHAAFPDHHPFSAADLAALARRFDNFAPAPKLLVTTEKDAVRLLPLLPGSPLAGLPLATIGMRTVILNEPEHFSDLIRRHVGTYPAHR